MFVFSRTNPDQPKHHSISYVLVDMKEPGVTMIPLPNMAGQVTFAQEFFENVRTSVDNVIGEEGTGWQQRRVAGNAGINPGPDSPWRVKRHFDQLVAHSKQPIHEGGSETLFDSPLVRQKLGRIATEIEVSNTLAWRNAWLKEREELTAREGESLGVFNRDLNQGTARKAVEILGLYGTLLPQNERWAPLRGWYADAYMFTVAATIYGGTIDIHRNLLAWALGLPRG
jgi:alkylation response protein AidB-like acyl-CoA dehydrogenase